MGGWVGGLGPSSRAGTQSAPELAGLTLKPPGSSSSSRDDHTSSPPAHSPAAQGTLLGLLAACGAELSILQCADRVVAADGAHILSTGYRRCMRPTALLPGDSSSNAAGGGSGSSGGRALPDGPAAGAGLGVAASLQDWVQRGAALGGEALSRAAAAGGGGGRRAAGQ